MNRRQDIGAKEEAAAPEAASKKRLKFTAGTEDDDDEELIMDDPKGAETLPGLATSRPMRRSAAQSLKKMKIDEEQQVRELLQGSARYDAGS